MIGGTTRLNTSLDEPNRTASFLDYDGAIAYQASDFSALMQSKRKGTMLRASLVQTLNPSVQLASTVGYNHKKAEWVRAPTDCAHHAAYMHIRRTTYR